MSETSLSQIDHAVQQVNIWLGELMMILDWNDRSRAYRALHTVLPLLRCHLPADEASQLAAQLPLFIRALFVEGWHPAKEPIKDRRGTEFIKGIAGAFTDTAEEFHAEIATAVLALLVRHVTPGEIAQVKAAFPEGIRRFWPIDQLPAERTSSPH